MIAWNTPDLPLLPGKGSDPTLTDSRRGPIPLRPGPTARLYVCGITPYDATHLGHAATYVTFDILNRTLRDAGHDVVYVQNVTDVDDPLLERAERDGVDWRDLAVRETQLFRDDMTALCVLPPDHYVGVVEAMGLIEAQVAELLRRGAAYALDVPEAENPAPGSLGDVYLDLAARADFGEVSGLDEARMDEVFAERGGDPQRPGKRGRFDPLLWRATRIGEPSWPSETLGAGRPGWHIECTSIALHYLGMDFDVQGGGTDLVFPHHEMSAVQACALTGGSSFAQVYVHQAMVGYEGHKMSKSRGNLVLVSRLRAEGVDPMTVRLALLNRHHGSDWEWTDQDLQLATARLDRWRQATWLPAGPAALPLLNEVREALADDLDTPRALAAVDAWTDDALGADTGAGKPDETAPTLVRDLVDSLLGITLREPDQK